MNYYATPVKVRKRPVVVHAMRFYGGAENAMSIVDWITSCDGHAAWYGPTETRAELLQIETLEGVMRARVDDWIVCGTHGEFYPVKPDIFVKTYEVMP